VLRARFGLQVVDKDFCRDNARRTPYARRRDRPKEANMNEHPICPACASSARMAAALTIARIMRAAAMKIDPRPIDERQIWPPPPPAW
jgi:hypothetical protein